MQRVHIAIIKDNNTSPTVLTIPDNPTNGDVIKAMFFEWVANHLKFHMGEDWWNAPYKTESEKV